MSNHNGNGDGWQGEYRGYAEGLRDQEFGHGQERYYGSLGEQMDRSQRETGSHRQAFPDQRPGQEGPPPERERAPLPEHQPPVGPAPERPQRSRGMLAAVAAVSAVLLVGGAATAWKLTQNDDAADPAASSSAPSTVAQSPTTSPSSSSDSGVPAVHPGWVVNAGNPDKGDQGAFDTPPETERFTAVEGRDAPVWKVEEPTTSYGVVSKGGRAGSHSPSIYRGGHCKNLYGDQSRGFFTWSRGQDDPLTTAGSVAGSWLDVLSVGQKGNKVTPEQPKTTQIKVNGGKTPAVQSLVRLPSPDHQKFPCAAPRLELRVIAFQAASSTPTVIMVRELGVPDQMPDAVVNQIISTIRPVG